MAVPTTGANVARLPLNVVPFRWGETISVNIPGVGQAEGVPRSGPNALQPRTRAFRVRGERAANRTDKLTLDLVSIDGPREFFLDLAVILLGESGELIASGHCSTSLAVEYQPIEKSFEIDLGKIRRMRSRNSWRSGCFR